MRGLHVAKLAPDPVIWFVVENGNGNLPEFEFPAGTGNIDEDPFFIEPEAFNYRIPKISECREVGNTALSPSSDIEGNPRTAPEAGNIVDMGAYEYQVFWS